MILTDHIARGGVLAHDWLVKRDRQVMMCNPDLNWPAAHYPLRRKQRDILTCSSCLLLRENRERREKAQEVRR